MKLLNCIPKEDENEVSHIVYNIGNNQPVKLMNFIYTLEKKVLVKP